jgi:CMP-N,N'-diacetyllegionaminic acid synthase
MPDNKIATLIVIPARGGSKGIIRKNVRMLGGTPLIGYAIRTAMATQEADHVVVSTEDEEIASVSENLGVEVLHRPVELAADHVTLTAVIHHAKTVFESTGTRLKRIVSLQPTSPLVRPESVSKAIRLHRETACDAVVSLSKIIHGHPYWTKSLDPRSKKISRFIDVDMDQYPQKQDLPACFTYSGGFYIRKTELLQAESKSGYCLGSDVRGYVLSHEETLDIDVEEDLNYFEYRLGKKKAHFPGD